MLTLTGLIIVPFSGVFFNYSIAESKVKQLEESSDDDLPQSDRVKQISTEPMKASLSAATGKKNTDNKIVCLKLCF